jgi:hypothetical protein
LKLVGYAGFLAGQLLTKSTELHEGTSVAKVAAQADIFAITSRSETYTQWTNFRYCAENSSSERQQYGYSVSPELVATAIFPIFAPGVD